MQNFAHCIDVSFASPIGKSIFAQFVLPHSASYPFLIHSLLAFSARHLHHLQPSRSHQMASLVHAQKAARLVNEQLDDVGPHNISHLYAACLVINMTSFADDSPSWIFQSDPAAFTWFMMQQGLFHLSSILQQHLPHSFWQIKHDALISSQSSNTLSVSSHLSSHPLFIDSLSSSLSPQMQDLFETHSDSPYYVPLQLLVHFHRNPSTDSLLSFGPRIPPSFRLRLLQKDPRALLLFHLWLQLLGRSSCWWIAGRVSRESAALILQLSHIPDLRIWKMVRCEIGDCHDVFA
ncbi:hypothetical protein MW887_012071 [Aspergillus wentii]|nr:hypothetical protein MW887_012071 [Aspergillus wentii]